MADVSSNNKRIAKNTILLYFRMVIVTIVSLFTARYTLFLLGVEDYGINNVVAGIVQFTGIITGTMVQATQRFLAFDLGSKNTKQFQLTYSMMTNIFLILCAIVIVVFEFIGPYCINKYLVIPVERLVAAQWIFQFSIAMLVLDTLNIPNTAAVIATEKMNVYAYFTFIDVGFKLLAVLMLYITPFDRLITFGLLNVLACLVRNVILHLYCKKRITGCIYIKIWDKRFFKKLSSYIGWSLLGSTNSILQSQGQAILLNLFFGPVINAAKAIADRIKSIVYSFSSNFYMAVTPQIVKTYAEGNIDYTKRLVLSSSKYAYYLLLILSYPIIVNMEAILNLWLGKDQVSPEMVAFSILTLVFGLIQVLECPITKAVQATGNVKKYELLVGCITLSFIPICYIVFYLGYSPYMSMVLLCVTYFIAQLYRIFYVRRVIGVSIREYSLSVFMPIILVTFITLLILHYVNIPSISILHIISSTIINILIIVSVIFFIGLNKMEKQYVKDYIQVKIKNEKL